MKTNTNSLLRNRQIMPNIDTRSSKNQKSKVMAVHSTYEVRWKNFKGFEDTGWIKIKPITILIGANNSGKTSFIAPFLLMNQTLSSRDSTSPLIAKGNLYDGGNISELIRNYDLTKEIFLGFRYHLHPLKKRLKKIGTYPPGAFEVTIGKSKTSSTSQTNEYVVLKQTIYDMYLREYISLTRDENNSYNLVGLELSPKEKEILTKVKPINYLFSPNTFLYFADKAQNEDHSEIQALKKFSKGFEDLLRIIAANYSQARNTILDLSYLGPVRENPHRYYEITDEVFSTVGLKGENMPHLLKEHLKNKKKQIDEWVKKFGFGDELILKNLSNNLLYSIIFKNKESKLETNIANTGFGASQILPLIVQALISNAESVTIAEQPEIHLNPRLQGELADLFVYMANRDQRVIVETHSEHILLRLRSLVASGKIKPNNVAIYFVEKQNDKSIIREIPMDGKGRISSSEWPVGFFDDTLRESLALAVAQSKK